MLCLFFLNFAAVPSSAQYREYYLYGKIMGTEGDPVAKAEIVLQDVATSRAYRITTDKKGEYKLIGLPHGIYQVTIKKEGFETVTVEWNFETPQDRMQKVEIPAITMVTRKQIEDFQRAKQAQAEFIEATEKVREGDYDGAILVLKKMISDNPRDANAHYLLGVSFLKKNMFPEAIAELEKTIELSPSFPGAYHQLGVYYQQQSEAEKALEFYRKALELDPKSEESLYNSGLILFELGRVEEALPYFERALEVRPNDSEFLEMAGRCSIHQENLAKALEYLEKARTNSSDKAKVDFLDGLITKLKEQIKK